MEKFHEFYDELLEVHELLDKGAIHADVAHDRLAGLLNRQENEAQRQSGHYGLDLYVRAKYAMAALADEILLRHDSAHMERWMSQLLEATLFRSQRAGEKVFDDIDEMQTLGSAGHELARVYLAVLGLGFQGVYRGLDNPDAKIEVYRQKLFRLACGDAVVMTGKRHMAAAAYASTLVDGESGELPHVRPWVWALVLVFVVYIGAGVAMWPVFSTTLRGLVNDVCACQPRSLW